MDKKELLRLIDQAAEEQWTALNLSEKGITELPPEIAKLKKNLTKLSLFLNKLS
jgi:Leucine-rich repeat (LRR) protein